MIRKRVYYIIKKICYFSIKLNYDVNLFGPDISLIAVYQKQPDESYLFLTTYKLVPAEVKHLQDSNGNFLTEKMINQ